MKRYALLALTVAGIGSATSAFAISATLSTNTTWGINNDGYLAPGTTANPGENPGLLQTDSLARGMAHNPVSGNVLLASRTGGNAVRILDTSGAQVGTLSLAGVTGGSGAVINKVGVGEDGRIYLANLTTNASTSALKIYRWDNEADTTPDVIYNGAPLAGARIGDSMDVIGSGANTRIVMGYSNSPTVAGNNGYAVFTQNSGGSLDAFHFGFPGTTPAAGDHRLGVTFIDNDTVLGGQNSNVRLSDFSIGGTATFLGSPVISSSVNNQRAFDFRVINGVPILVTMDSAGSGVTRDSVGVPNGNYLVRVFDFTNTATPTLLASGVIPNTGFANGNGTGEIKIAYGGTGANATIYAMATNNGIQSFNLQVVPEPATMTALGLGLAALARRRKAKKS